MKYRQLGRTGVYVSELCLGAMTFGTEWEVIGALGQRDADALVGASIDAGINFFDTADVYSTGDSEEILGKALASKRQEVVIATKVRGRMGPGANEVGLSRLHIIQACEASLRRLGTDYIDLYQIHRGDPDTDIEETLSALSDLVRAGKVRYVGCSNLPAWELMKALGVSERRGIERFCATQSYYSLSGRDLEHDTIPLIEDQGLALLVWSPLAGGFLTGKFTREGARDREARRASFDFPPIDREQTYDILAVMAAVAEAHGVSVAQVAIAWLLAKSAVTSVIIGAKRMDQLRDNLGAVDVELSAEEVTSLDEVSARPRPYPMWMLALGDDRRPGQKRDLADILKREAK
ncbi:MAG: aldo/keto reductase [Acidobacteria bacterium]|nr:aldo/keto reductase [Acidobacteriota bacterium]